MRVNIRPTFELFCDLGIDLRLCLFEWPCLREYTQLYLLWFRTIILHVHLVAVINQPLFRGRLPDADKRL
jgi:hypothetical protein